MTNFISVKYCALYLLSMYTIGSYSQVSTRNPEQFKTTDSIEFIPKIRQEFIKVMNNAIDYSRNYGKRLMRFEEKLRNFREKLENIGDESVKHECKETLDKIEDQLVVARNYLRLIKEGESTDRLEAYLIDMETRLEVLRLRYVYIKYIGERRDQVRRSERQTSDSDERREQLRRSSIRQKSELHKDSLKPHVTFGMRLRDIITS